MTTVLSRAIAAVRVWLGLDPAEMSPQPPHGWLLPPSSAMRALALDRVLRLAPIPVTVAATGRRR
jgi:hypothetical protein